MSDFAKVAARFAILAVLCIASVPLALALEATDIVGVWRTIDASDEEGRRQGGIVFRKDGTGEFISATWETSDLPPEIMQLLSIPSSGTNEISFIYTVEADTVTTTITHFGGMEVKSDPVRWTASVDDERLELHAEDGSKWIALNKAL